MYVCGSDGRKYPQVYLCGKNASVRFKITNTEAKQYVWEKLIGNRTGDINCPPTNTSWGGARTTNSTTTEEIFTEAGEYRLTITFNGNCVSTYYFRITKSELDAKIEYTDIVCNTSGKIIVKNVPSGYQFALMQEATTITNYRQSNL